MVTRDINGIPHTSWYVAFDALRKKYGNEKLKCEDIIKCLMLTKGMGFKIGTTFEDIIDGLVERQYLLKEDDGYVINEKIEYWMKPFGEKIKIRDLNKSNVGEWYYVAINGEWHVMEVILKDDEILLHNHHCGFSYLCQCCFGDIEIRKDPEEE